jgi:hypothetical protein
LRNYNGIAPLLVWLQAMKFIPNRTLGRVMGKIEPIQSTHLIAVGRENRIVER